MTPPSISEMTVPFSSSSLANTISANTTSNATSNTTSNTISNTTTTTTLNKPNPNSILPFIHLLENLKNTPRTGWLNESIPNPESISDHMYRMSILAFLNTDPEIDTTRCIKLALVHDMAEAIVGDITPLDKISKPEKHRLEREAMSSICHSLLPLSQDRAAREIMGLFEEYEKQETQEARFIKDVDRYELLVQTIEYEKRAEGGKELGHFVKSAMEIKHPLVREWCEDALRERDAYWASLK